jgi:hypothetical protein
MTQADSVHSTPPTSTSPTRRNILGTIAAAGVTALTLTPARAAAPSVDPVFAAIDSHRKAYAAMQAAFVETARVESIADDKVGLSHIDVPSMVEPGATVRAICWWDIEQAVPSKEHPDMYAHHLGLLEKRRADREAIVEPIIGDVDEFSDPACSDEFEALNEFAETVPTTLNGLLAMIIYAGEITDKNADAFDQSSPLFENMATAAQALIRVQP